MVRFCSMYSSSSVGNELIEAIVVLSLCCGSVRLQFLVGCPEEGEELVACVIVGSTANKDHRIDCVTSLGTVICRLCRMMTKQGEGESFERWDERRERVDSEVSDCSQGCRWLSLLRLLCCSPSTCPAPWHRGAHLAAPSLRGD